MFLYHLMFLHRMMFRHNLVFLYYFMFLWNIYLGFYWFRVGCILLNVRGGVVSPTLTHQQHAQPIEGVRCAVANNEKDIDDDQPGDGRRRVVAVVEDRVDEGIPMYVPAVCRPVHQREHYIDGAES